MSSFIDLVRPRNKISASFFDITAVFLASCFIALMAQTSIRLSFTLVPITMQTLALALISGVLGTKRGVAAVLLYLAEGAMGLPVFTGFRSGLVAFTGPTVGYLFGFVLYVYVVASLLEKGWRNHFALTFLAMIFGSVLLYLCGMICLTPFVGGLKPAFMAGVSPFLLGEFLKILFACSLIPSGWKWINNLKNR